MYHRAEDHVVTMTHHEVRNLINTLGCLTYIGLLPPLLILRGYVLTVLWGWFLVPTLGLPELRMAPAIGLMIIVTFVTPIRRRQPTGKTELEQGLLDGTQAVLMAVIALSLGWVVHQFM